MTSPSYGSGYYAAAPKKSSPKFLIVLAILLAAGLLAVVLLRDSGPEPTPSDDPDVALASAQPDEEPEGPLIRIGESDRDEELDELCTENARLRDDLKRLEDVLSGVDVEDQVRELEAENARLREENRLLQDEVARHRIGLEQAVAELNASRRPAGRSQPAKDSSGDSSKWVFPRDPYAVVNVGRVDIEGSVHNANGETVTGFVVLTVFEYGRQLRQDRVGPITISGKTVEDYRFTISDPRIQHGSSYEVRATWVSQ